MTKEKIKLKLTKFQWSNLRKLHDYLVKNKKKVEPHFDISVYLQLKNSVHPDPIDGKQIKNCGSVGCLIGHGIVAGIPAYSKDSNWGIYADRVFGTDCKNPSMDTCPLYNWVFNGHWASTQPTLDEAIKRLSYVLKHKAVPA